ncbi:MAG: T9SS type A sorting domain-containing protein [Muribaculaceae bacterium]|nr:T9SS type A sorting domain-containing protein [Muribaculaceae bacterium]
MQVKVKGCVAHATQPFLFLSPLQPIFNYNSLHNGSHTFLTLIERGNNLYVAGFEGETLTVYNLNGAVVLSQLVKSNNETVALNAGVYVVKVADKDVKVVVK